MEPLVQVRARVEPLLSSVLPDEPAAAGEEAQRTLTESVEYFLAWLYRFLTYIDMFICRLLCFCGRFQIW